MAYKYAVNPETGERKAYRSATDGEETTWVEVPIETAPAASQRDRREGATKQRARRIENKRARYMDKIEDRGPAAVARAEEAENMGFLEKSLILAGRETDKLLAGSANLVDFLMDTLGDTGAVGRTLKRAQEQEEKDRLSRELLENAGASGFFGPMAPYLLTGYAGGPIAAKVGQKVISAPAAAATRVGSEAKGALTTGVEALAARPGLAGRVGQKAKREITDPLQRRSMRKSKQIKEVDPYREGAASTIIGGGTLGAIEGGLHYDNDPITGAIAGLGGAATGVAARPMLTKAPVYWDTNEQRLVDWAEDQGMKFLPGMRTGSKRAQRFEAGLRQDNTWTDVVSQVDRNNTTIMNRVAFRAAGIPEGKIDVMTPEDLRSHMKGLRNEYERLTMETTGRIGPKRYAELKDTIQGIAQHNTKGTAAAAKQLNRYLNRFERISTVKRNKRGRFTRAEFDGRDYQKLRSDLKNDMDAAWDKKKMHTYEGLKVMINTLDEGIARGMKKSRGIDTVAKWKNLNERYAMSKLLIEKGLDPVGKVDASRLTSHFLTHDPERLMLESGGMVDDLHKLVKVNHMMKNQAGSALTTDGMRQYNRGNLSFTQRLLGSRLMEMPVAGMVPLLPSAYMQAYKRGYPSVTGLLGMSGKGFGDPALYTRGMAQGSQIHPKMVDYVTRRAEDTASALDQFLTEHQQEEERR